MIINTKTVIVTLILIAALAYVGLRLVRSFALSIAVENHEANMAYDEEAQALQTKREREADAAAATAFAKVEPLLKAVPSSSATAKDAVSSIPTKKKIIVVKVPKKNESKISTKTTTATTEPIPTKTAES